MCFHFRKQAVAVEEKERSFADEVRKYAKSTYVTPARQKGLKQVTFSASDLHHGLHYNARFALVCSAIDAKKFSEFARVKLVKRTGPKQSSTVKWTFEVLSSN